MTLIQIAIISNITWLILIITMIKLKRSWIDIVIVAIVINIIGIVIGSQNNDLYWFIIIANTLYFSFFIIGVIFEKFKKNA